MGYYIRNDLSRGLKVYSDTNFAGAYDKDIAHLDADTSKSRHGFVVMYAGAPILWQLPLQTETTLSSTELELIGLSMALQTAIPIMNMLQEMQDKGFKVSTTSRIHCKVFEDNNRALEIAKIPKMHS
jgi:hypothetical protein